MKTNISCEMLVLLGSRLLVDLELHEDTQVLLKKDSE